jgi:hypothetical protein
VEILKNETYYTEIKYSLSWLGILEERIRGLEDVSTKIMQTEKQSGKG